MDNLKDIYMILKITEHFIGQVQQHVEVKLGQQCVDKRFKAMEVNGNWCKRPAMCEYSE